MRVPGPLPLKSPSVARWSRGLFFSWWQPARGRWWSDEIAAGEDDSGNGQVAQAVALHQLHEPRDLFGCTFDDHHHDISIIVACECSSARLGIISFCEVTPAAERWLVEILKIGSASDPRQGFPSAVGRILPAALGAARRKDAHALRP